MATTRKHIAPVLVIGATGNVGSLVVDELLAASVPVRALSRHPESGDVPAGVETVSGDLTMPESLDAALQGVSAVFLVWVAPVAHAADAIARIAAHTKRIIYLSAPSQTPHPFFQQPNPMAAVHAELERLIDERDLARVAARALHEDGFANGDYVLTGPESLTHADQARIIGEALGRSIRFEEASPEEFRRHTSGTWPPLVVDMLLNAWHAAVGLPAYVTTAVGDLTGTPARTFRQWVDDHREAFQ